MKGPEGESGVHGRLPKKDRISHATNVKGAEVEEYRAADRGRQARYPQGRHPDSGGDNHRGSEADNIVISVELKGGLDLQVLTLSLHQMLRLHDLMGKAEEGDFALSSEQVSGREDL